MYLSLILARARIRRDVFRRQSVNRAPILFATRFAVEMASALRVPAGATRDGGGRGSRAGGEEAPAGGRRHRHRQDSGVSCARAAFGQTRGGLHWNEEPAG